MTLPETASVHDAAIRVIDYRCKAGPGDAPYVEAHSHYSLSYVRSGSF